MRRFVLFSIAGLLAAQEVPSPVAANLPGMAFFEQKVRPLLAGRCYPCHSSKQSTAMGGLQVDSRDGLLRGGSSGPAVVPGKPEESLMVAAIRGTNQDLKMPRGGKPLDAREVDDIVEWIRMGAPDPRDLGSQTAPARAADYDWDKARRHWAFRPVQVSEPPLVAPAEWNKTPVDRFIKARLDEQGETPLPRASKLALIRRVTFDLTGLPPTPKEVDAFVADTSANALEKVVDRLLASQQYGERWGRHWLDVARYADTAGNSADFPVPAMYRYRNWVISSFNADRPYDQFLRDQIAGDILASKDRAAKDKEDWQQKLIATGYIANSRRFGSVMADFHLTIDDTIDALGKGILGLTVGCARCHNHKFDPIPTADYYALYGIFQSTSYAHPGSEVHKHPFGFASIGNETQSKKLQNFQSEVNSIDSALDRIRVASLNGLVLEGKEKIEADAQSRLKRLSAQAAQYEEAKAYAVYSVSEGKPENARVYVKGDPDVKGAVVPRGFLTVLGGQKVPPEEKGSGRRELAEWITDPANPLTARVIVNRVWTWHFGQGIVDTPDDFGTRGGKPSHPQLLDYLTHRFVAEGWSIKKLHKLIVLTRAYQTASGDDARNAAKDPGNKYLWKFTARRLDAEEFRDALLTISGKLDPAVGGPHPFPPELDWGFTQHKPFLANYEHNKRSVYLMQQRIRKNPYLELFDGADTGAVTGLRPASTTALQALYTMNDPFFHEVADTLAVRVGMAYSTDADRLRYAYKLVYGRAPLPDEIRSAVGFLAGTRKALQDAAVADDQQNRQAWANLMQVLFSSNEFLTIE